MEMPSDQIKRKIDIVDFLGGYIALKKAGRNYKAICPFHQEKSPSFVVSPDRQIWHCFGSCSEGGDIFRFLMKWENITFYEALKELAEKAGVKLQKVDFEDRLWEARKKIFAINSIANEYYQFILKKHKVGTHALEYLKTRGINSKIIDTFNLGYSPDSWDSLLKFLKKKGFKQDEIESTGLLVKSERGSVYDRFRKRLTFPLKDSRGNILGFSGRILNGEKMAKYVNTPETSVYHKRETLYGIDLAKESIKKHDRAILVEGEFDMISLFQEGLTNTVAVKGSAVTADQLIILKRFTKKISLALDTDSAGDETTKRAITEAEKLEFEIGVIAYDFGKDPDEAIKTDPVKFKKMAEKPIPIYDFIIDLAIKKNKDGDAFSKKNIGDEVMPYLANIKNPIVQSYYTKKIAALLDVDVSAIEVLKRRQASKKSFVSDQKPVREKSKVDRYELLQKYILALIFQNTDPLEMAHKIFKIIEIEDFQITAYQKLIQYLLNAEAFDSKIFIKNLPKELIPVFDEIYLFDIEMFDEDLVDKELDKSLYQFRQISLKKRIKEKMGMEDREKSKEVTALLDSLSQLEKKRTFI